MAAHRRGFLSDREREAVQAIAALATDNPFLPERIEHERRALGGSFRRVTAVWHADADIAAVNPNVEKLTAVVERLAPDLRERLVQGAHATAVELEAYQGLVRYLLYYRCIPAFDALIEQSRSGRPATERVRDYARFRDEVAHYLELPCVPAVLRPAPGHLYAWGYQIRRAFVGTFRGMYGGSLPAANLRAAVWQSIFTHDTRRYARSLYDRMGDVTTLVLGESGTGKELVARAIAGARYIPFDAETSRFREDSASGFRAVNLSALSPTLIESELFGHRRGAFTGALQDREGWLESCPATGTVFLDEIGELAAPVQVKLLRVLQSRQFQRVGEIADRRFAGKLVAATNRDLPAEIADGRFREDLYYRLCADVIRTPTLREQIADSPDELPGLIQTIAQRIVDEQDAEELTTEVVTFCRDQLGRDYPWPGNVRELEQCVRNVLVRGHYRPAVLERRDGGDELARLLREGSLSADELLRRYCRHVYELAGSYEEAARRLGLDRRTVRARIASTR